MDQKAITMILLYIVFGIVGYKLYKADETNRIIKLSAALICIMIGILGHILDHIAELLG